MVCTQLHSSSTHQQHWKTCRTQDPYWIQSIFRNNFKSPLGIVCISGLFGSGFMVYASHVPLLVSIIPYFDMFLILTLLGRTMTMMAEVWLCFGYFSMIIEQDTQKREREQQQQQQQQTATKQRKE